MRRYFLAFLAIAVFVGAQRPATKVKRNDRDGLIYAAIPPGSFQMGCSSGDCPANERPAHKVTISRAFWIGTTETTVEAYKRFAHATGRAMPPDEAEGFNVNPGWKNDLQPIVNVTWDEAADYCKWAGGALPSEAQWEYAARGGSTQDPYGPLDEIAWTASNSGRARIDADAIFRDDKAHYEERIMKNGNRPHDVAQKTPNGFGLYDMIGNVAEWTNDWFDPTYYSHSPETDPQGADSSPARVSRGGHFIYPSVPNRASKRLWNAPQGRSPVVGFRCMME